MHLFLAVSHIQKMATFVRLFKGVIINLKTPHEKLKKKINRESTAREITN